MPTLDDHEARIAALEASQAHYRAVIAAVNAVGANQREHSLRISALETELASLRQETRGQFRSVEEHFAEMRDLIIDLRNSR